ncbi:MAG: hypothetical protein FJ196_06545, partial [Gammaproteobacteria bacterium]|nr:hypothetical protein [Gammaproteobacteria bacterium]
AVRDRVALFDQASFAKYLVQGRDALAVLDRMSTARIDVDTGRLACTGPDPGTSVHSWPARCASSRWVWTQRSQLSRRCASTRRSPSSRPAT